MKIPFLCVLLGLYLYPGAYAQQFSRHELGSPGTTPDSRSVNCVDVNNDGWDDLFISNGPKHGQYNYLYVNDGKGSLKQLKNDPLVRDSSAFDGATFADADNDGDVDAFIVTWYGKRNFFYRNKGNGTFVGEADNVTGNTGTYSETASFGDYDNDGLLDIYISNSAGDKRNMLYKNTGKGFFTGITSGSAAVTDTGTSRSINWTDYDNDGDADLFVSNENEERNDLYRNEGTGIFTKITTVAPVLDTYSTMSSSWADVDNDGDLDLFLANSGNSRPQNNQLFKNEGNGNFHAVPSGAIVTDGGCSFSAAFEDYDNDGDLDLFVSNGFCRDSIVNFLYRNNGSGEFTRDLDALPDYNTPCSYGCGWGDFDNNGFPDLVVATCRSSPASPKAPNLLFMNKGNGNHWIKIRLRGTRSNRSAIGAKVFLKARINGQTVTQMREVSAQTGYCSQNSLTVHFGLADAVKVEGIEVKWPSGKRSTLGRTEIDQVLEIKEK